MIRILKDTVIDAMSPDNAPVARCASGETVVFETRDCYDDGVTSSERPLGDREDLLANPATGPLYVEGAEKGDVLKVEILDIKLRSWGVMRSSIEDGAFADKYDVRSAEIFDLSDGLIHFDDKLSIDIEAMIGVIGTAPESGSVPTVTPGSHGGNMDCRKICEGAVLYLPVNVDGGLLTMGDLHARMGDGEVFICGVETAGEVTVRVTVLKGCTLPTPFLSSDGSVMTIQSADDLDAAGNLAIKKMFGFVKEATGNDDLKTGMLMSLLCNMAICQIVDPQLTVRAEFPLSALEKYGYRLP